MSERKEARVRSDRCDGMRDVLALKRKREAELNATQRHQTAVETAKLQPKKPNGDARA